MNSVASKAEYSVQATTPPDVAAVHIGRLFVSLQSENKGAATRAVMADYLDVVSDIPEWAIEQAVDLYRRGHKGNGRFVPTASEFAHAAREIVRLRRQIEQEQFHRKRDAELMAEQFAERKQRELVRAGITPESKARVGQKLEEAKAIIAANRLEKDRQVTGPSIHEQTHEKYRAQAREALLKSPGRSR